MLNWRELLFYSDRIPLDFSRYLFLFLFSVGFLFFTLVYKRFTLRNIYLLAFSLFFYYKTGGMYFWILVFSTLVDFGCGNAIYNSAVKWERKFFLVVSMVSNLGTLAFFKYSYYITDTLNYFFGTSLKATNFLAVMGNELFDKGFDIHEIILPVGISFYTFQTMSYTIDIFRGQLKPTRNIVDFGFFVTFFPQLVAGPIVRAADFLPQIYKKFHLTREQFGIAVFLIINGLVKKMVVSNYISVNFVDRIFKEPNLYSGFENLMAVYGYSIQIYCDFSGYSDMAIGLAALLGFKLPINFNSPYKATSITDFWRRWHISLSTWLRDYLYISLGGNRKGKIRTYVNLMITMLLGGLWHGAATRFIVWGGLHGLALAVHKVWARYVPIARSGKRWYKIAAGLVTFHFVAYCWVYFRAGDMTRVNLMLKRIFTDFEFSTIGERIAGYAPTYMVMALGFIIHFIPLEWKHVVRDSFVRIPLVAKTAIVALVIFCCYQVQTADIQPFIYFQF